MFEGPHKRGLRYILESFRCNDVSELRFTKRKYHSVVGVTMYTWAALEGSQGPRARDNVRYS